MLLHLRICEALPERKAEDAALLLKTYSLEKGRLQMVINGKADEITETRERLVSLYQAFSSRVTDSDLKEAITARIG